VAQLPDDDKESSPTGKAVVAGGGLAGLAAAYRLANLGWSVTVLEKEQEAGGRCRTAGADGFLFDTGAQHCRDSYDATLKTAIELALGDRFRVPIAPKALYRAARVEQFVPRSTRSVAQLPWRALGARGLFDVPSAVLPLFRKYRSYNIRFPGWWMRGDLETADAFLDGRASADYKSALAEPLALYAIGAELDRISAAGLMVATRVMFADRTVSFTTGMGSLAAALARKVDVETGTQVTGVLFEGGAAVGLKARPAGGGRSRSYSAELVVCALPAPHVKRICGTLGGAARTAIEEARYSAAVVVNLAYARAAGGVAGPVMFPGSEGFQASWASSNASKADEHAPAGGAVVTVVFSGRRAEALLENDDGPLADLAVCEASRVYSIAGSRPVGSRVDRHHLGRPIVSPGHSARVRGLIEEGSGVANLLLAGDWTTSPTVEGAVSSGFAAAERAGAPG
jgi:oxygen-dependent protoporphyrinogen oxidase